MSVSHSIISLIATKEGFTRNWICVDVDIRCSVNETAVVKRVKNDKVTYTEFFRPCGIIANCVNFVNSHKRKEEINIHRN